MLSDCSPVMMTTDPTPPLSQAPPAVQLAVDLIMLLEQHALAPDVVLAALGIVKADYQRKAKSAVTTDIKTE